MLQYFLDKKWDKLVNSLEPAKIAVYGSLRKGHYNHLFLTSSRFVGIDRLDGWDMYSNGSFPYVVVGKGSITVEVYEVSGPTLSKIDHLEGYPVHYSRTRVETRHGSCWLYHVERVPEGCFAVPGGDWAGRKIQIKE